MIPDIINGAFELFGCAAISFAIASVWRARSWHGTSIVPNFFFTAWGFWNLYFYPHVGQFWSTVGAGLTAGANVVLLWLMWKFRKRSK